MIRYLGNPKGTDALYLWLGDLMKNPKKKQFIIAAGAIPLPVNQWEFNFAEARTKEFGTVLESSLSYDNIYPLLLDDSQKSKNLLNQILETTAKKEDGDYWITRTKKIIRDNPRKVFYVKDTLEKTALENAYFLHLGELSGTSVRLLAYNGRKDKAWLLFGNFGAVWHIVLEKDGQGWKFFSITQTSVS